MNAQNWETSRQYLLTCCGDIIVGTISQAMLVFVILGDLGILSKKVFIQKEHLTDRRKFVVKWMVKCCMHTRNSGFMKYLKKEKKRVLVFNSSS